MKKEQGLKYIFSEDVQYFSGRKADHTRWKHMVSVAVVAVLVVFSITSFVVIDHIYDDIFARVDKPERTIYQTYGDVASEFVRTEVTFQSEGTELQAYIYGIRNTKGLVVISHGIGGGAESYIKEATYFARKGYRVFTFDNTGCYGSAGDSINGLSQSVIDLDAALDYIKSDPELVQMPILLYGHSWGGYAVTSILNYQDGIAGVISVAPYNTPMELIMEYSKDMMGPFRYIEYPYIWLYQKVLFGGAGNLSAVDGINNTDIPVMVIHGTGDEVIAYDGASVIAHKDKVTNPNAVFRTYSEEGKNGHTNLFYSRNALKYQEEVWAEYAALEAEYLNEDGTSEIPEKVVKDWYLSIDKEQTSELDEVFMREAYNFFEDAIDWYDENY